MQAKDELDADENRWRRVGRRRASGPMPFAGPRSSRTGSSWVQAPCCCGSPSALLSALRWVRSGSSRAPLRSIADCGCTTYEMASGSAVAIADLPDPSASGKRIQVPKDQLQRYTARSYETVSRRFQESVFLGFILALAASVMAAPLPARERSNGDRRPPYPRDHIGRQGRRNRAREGRPSPFRAWGYLPDPDLLDRPFSVRRFVEDEGSDVISSSPLERTSTPSRDRSASRLQTP